MKRNEIPIVFSTDEEYFIPTYIAIISMLMNIRGRDIIQVYVIIPNQFPVRYRESLKKLETDYKFCRIDFINVGEIYQSVEISIRRISVATLYRLLLPELLKEYKCCLYLDSDIVVQGDINELLNIDLDDNYIAGVHDSVLFDNKEMCSILGIPFMRKYINAGVLLLNLERLREEGVDKILKKMGYKKYPYNDQDILNIACYSGIKIIPPCNNVLGMYIHRNDKEFSNMFGKEDIKNARNNPLIIHYVSFRKPWVYKYMPNAGYWRDVISMVDEQFRDEFIIPFLKKNNPKSPARDYLIMWCIYLAMKAGLYPTLKRYQIIMFGLIKHFS